MDIQSLVESRYATKEFTGEKLSDEVVDAYLEQIRLAPSSFGLQPFSVFVVSDAEKQAVLREHSFDQKQITSASHLLVFAVNTDLASRIDEFDAKITGMWPDEAREGFVGWMKGFVLGMSEADQFSWAARNMYIALGFATLFPKAHGFDSCPLEGVVGPKYDEVLGLDEKYKTVAVVAIGKAADSPKPKIRFDDVIQKL